MSVTAHFTAAANAAVAHAGSGFEVVAVSVVPNSEDILVVGKTIGGFHGYTVVPKSSGWEVFSSTGTVPHPALAIALAGGGTIRWSAINRTGEISW